MSWIESLEMTCVELMQVDRQDGFGVHDVPLDLSLEEK